MPCPYSPACGHGRAVPLRALPPPRLCALCAFALAAFALGEGTAGPCPYSPACGHGRAVPLQPCVWARQGRAPTALRVGTAGPCPYSPACGHGRAVPLRALPPPRLCALCAFALPSFALPSLPFVWARHRRAPTCVTPSAPLRPLRLCVNYRLCPSWGHDTAVPLRALPPPRLCALCAFAFVALRVGTACRAPTCVTPSAPLRPLRPLRLCVRCPSCGHGMPCPYVRYPLCAFAPFAPLRYRPLHYRLCPPCGHDTAVPLRALPPPRLCALCAFALTSFALTLAHLFCYNASRTQCPKVARPERR
ncbi:MAG: hypothetical protein KatS3mg055_1639 [Chloroflexus sp.]|nr:MAG: hypothetical protein KatS3mg055_1639 [Chloroflexus sp.]